MRRIFIVATFFLLSYGSVYAENITQLDVTIEINADARIDIIETIQYDFGDLRRHGIYRDIPVKYKTQYGNTRKIDVDDIAVTDASGSPIPFDLSWHNGQRRIKIGDANTYVTGQKTYVITYTVDRAINYFDTHDELYWNAVGDNWKVPIDRASVAVSAPAIDRSECFFGAYGSTAPCIESGDVTRARVAYAHDDILPGEGMTVVIGMPIGTVHKPTIMEKIGAFIMDNIILLFPVIVLVFMWQMWKKRGKDPAGRETVVPYYESPRDLSPAQAAVIVYEKVRNSDISALIINLAVKGYLRIRQIQEKKLLVQADYLLIATEKDITQNTAQDEVMLYHAIFGEGGKKREVTLSSLTNKIYKDVEKIMTHVRKEVVTKGYYVRDPKVVRAAYFAIGAIIFGAAFFVVGFLGISGLTAFILASIPIFVYGYYMPQKTVQGMHAYEEILGLKMYMETAEKDRINFHNAPEKKPEKFEELLPFAMVLGVEEQWAQQFENIYNARPQWYEGSGPFVASALAHDLHSFSSVASTVSTSRPSSAGSGGSGFSGGGGGGGFGGGGGGSW